MGDEGRHLSRRPKARTGPVEDFQDDDFDPEGPSQADLDRFSDVSVVCTGCGTELLDDVRECWKCGREVGAKSSHESGLPTWAVIVVVILALALLGWFGRGFF